MIRCHKCGSDTVPVNAKVTVTLGDSTMQTITEAKHCTKCGENQTQFQFKIEPMGLPKGKTPEMIMEVKGNA